MHPVEELQSITLTGDGLNECNLWRPQVESARWTIIYWVHWKFNQLETRCGRESQHPAEGALLPPIERFEDQTSWREDAGMRTCLREAGLPGPRLSSPGERERNAVMANRVGVNMLQFCSVSNSISHTTLSIKWEVYFSKDLCRLSLLCRRYDFACNDVYVFV